VIVVRDWDVASSPSRNRVATMIPTMKYKYFVFFMLCEGVPVCERCVVVEKMIFKNSNFWSVKPNLTGRNV
jgi:hypothetical protein